jgi:hypothetical protein
MIMARTNNARVAKEEMAYTQNVSEFLMLGEVYVGAAGAVESI